MTEEEKEDLQICNDYISLIEENKQLKQQLEEEKNIRNKAIEFVNNI